MPSRLVKKITGYLILGFVILIIWNEMWAVPQESSVPPSVNSTPGWPAIHEPLASSSTFPPIPTMLTPSVILEPLGTHTRFQSSSEVIDRTYAWAYGGKDWTWHLQLPQGLYDYFKSLPRPDTSDYSVYVTHPFNPYIARLASKIQQAAQEEGYSVYETIELAASFVQNLPYVSDNLSTNYDEYPRYPIETMVDNGGDCEDTSILMASLLKEMGYGVVLLRISTTPGHMAVGVAGDESAYGSYWENKGRRYYYLETTGTDWEIGKIPAEYRNTAAKI